MKQNTYYKKICNMLLIVLSITIYQGIVTNRLKSEQIIKLQSELETANTTITFVKEQIGIEEENEDSGNFKDGTFTGEGVGFGGKILVEVEVKQGKLTDINIKEAKKEDAAYLTMAKDIIAEIKDKQETNVDTVSGATYSSEGIKEAVEDALEQAVTKDE